MTASNYVNFLHSIPLMIKGKREGIFVWSWGTAICCLIIGRGFPPVGPAALTIFTMVFLSTSVYVYNDVIDRDMDKINPLKGDRPIVQGLVDPKDALKLVYISAALGLLLAAYISIPMFITSLAYWVLLYSYSQPAIRLKKRLLLNEGTIFVGFIIAGLMASYGVAGSIYLPAVFSGGLFGLYIALLKPVFSDTLDQEEDKLYGMKTLGSVLSWKRKMQLLIMCILFIMTMTPLTYARLGFSTVLPIFVVAISLLFLRVVFPLMNNFDPTEVLKARKFAHIYLIAFQLLLIIGTLQLALPFPL